MVMTRLMIFCREVCFMGVQKSLKLEVNRLTNKNFNSVELYWGLGAENAILLRYNSLPCGT